MELFRLSLTEMLRTVREGRATVQELVESCSGRIAALAMVNMAIIGVAIWIAYRISAGYAGLGFAAARRNDPAPITT